MENIAHQLEELRWLLGIGTIVLCVALGCIVAAIETVTNELRSLRIALSEAQKGEQQS